MFSWRNTTTSWSALAILFHWLSVVTVYGLYILGWYMVDLEYYDAWYRSAPFWHKSIGVTLFVVIAFRIGLRCIGPIPQPLPTHKPWERLLAEFIHFVLYCLLFVVFISGYFISTADGRSIAVYDLFELPALISGIDHLEDWAGDVHIYATNALITLSILHALAALKHHVVDRDSTLKRMLGVRLRD